MPRWRRLNYNGLPLEGIIGVFILLILCAILPNSNGRSGKLTGINATPYILPQPIYDKDAKLAHSHQNNANGVNSSQPSFLLMHSSQPSSLLMHLLVMITFHWDVTKLVYLERMLDIVSSYRTRVDILVVTDRSSAVRSVLASWGREKDVLHSIKVWQASARATAPEVGKTGSQVEYAAKYTLLWAHRNAIKTQIHTLGHSYSAVFYMEDDTRLDWPAVVSWALDTEVLEPINLTRCFYRTEVDASKGTPNMLDWQFPMKVTDENILDMAPAQTPVNKAGKEWSTGNSSSQERRWPLKDCHELKLRDGSSWACAPHRRYIRPAFPFQGLWAASRKQLAAFMAHPYWNERDAVLADIPYPLGYPERSNGMDLFLNTPDGQVSNCAVPILVIEKTFSAQVRGQEAALVASLPVVAAVEHMRKGYSGGPLHHGKLPVQQALVFY